MRSNLAILLLFSTAICFAQQSRFKEGDTIYVWALSGLNMRKLPDAQSEKMVALPYGTKVTVQSNIGIIVAHEVEEFKNFKVKGVWLLVKYDDQEGFIFDGYMSQLIAPQKNVDNYLFTYLKKSVGKIGKTEFIDFKGGKKRYLREEENIDKLITIVYGGGHCKVVFSNGISYSLHIGEVSEETYTFPNVSLYEGYIFIKTVFSRYEFQYDKTAKKFIIDDTEICGFDIFMKNKNLIVYGGCNC